MKINSIKIKIMMASKGMNVTSLARLCEISRQGLSTILTRGTCSIISAGKIANGLGVPLESILED